MRENRKMITYSMINVLVELQIENSSKGLSFIGHHSCVHKAIIRRALVLLYYLNVSMFLKMLPLEGSYFRNESTLIGHL